MDKVLVGIRCRPVTPAEAGSEEQIHDFFVNDDERSITTLKNKYVFNHIFTPKSVQSDVFKKMGKMLVEKVSMGYNGTILAYGQTGSGKSFTMGTEFVSASQGITQYALGKLFETCDSSVNISISVVEIYREEIYDLLTTRPTKLNVFQGLKAVNMSSKTIYTLQEGENVIMWAMKNRRIGATKGNLNSSRSHMIVSVSVTNALGTAKLNLVDLAGSEKVSENDVQRNEGVAINSGLLHLLRVVDSLSKGSSHIPYRDSKLTFLLKDSLSANNYIALIACINSIKKNLEETEKTLDFASKFANIQVTPLIGTQRLGTPYKTSQHILTPQRQNRTFATVSSSEIFKKPLVPLNRTVATPISWGMKRKEEGEWRTPMIRISNFGRDSESFNMSSVSTSTAITESPPDRLDATTEPSPNFDPITMTPGLQALIQASVNASIKASSKRWAQSFHRKLQELGKYENKESWSRRLSEVGLDKSLDLLSDNDTLSGDELQNTVMETNTQNGGVDDLKEDTPFKPLPSMCGSADKKGRPSGAQHDPINQNGNLNGSYISDDSCPSDSRGGYSESDLISYQELGFKKPRRSMRLSSVKTVLQNDSRNDSDETPGSKSGNSDSGNSHLFKKPTSRRSIRLSATLTRPPQIFTRPIFDGSLTDSNKTSDSNDGNSDLGNSHLFKKPAPRRSIRLSASLTRPPQIFTRPTFDGSLTDLNETSGSNVGRKAIAVPAVPAIPNTTLRPNVRVSLVRVDKVNKNIAPTETRGRRPIKTTKKVADEDAHLSHEEKILEILRTGDTKELVKLPTIGLKTAALILVHRDLHGPLCDLGDFENIRGLTKNQAKKFLWANSLI